MFHDQPNWLKGGRRLERLLRFLKKMSLSRAIKLGGVALALVVTCLPLLFWPSHENRSGADGKSQTVITAPRLAVVPNVILDSSTSTTLRSTASVTTTEPTTELTAGPPLDITIAAVGDVIIHDSVRKAAYNSRTGQYDFKKMFAPIAPYLSAADYTLCNLESRLAGGDVSVGGSLRFNAPYALTDALTMAGVDLAATANNHSVDFGWTGIVRTLNRLDKAGIAHVGTNRSLKDKNTPLIVDIKGIKVAFLNYTDVVNGNKTVKGREAYAVNMLDVDKVAQEAMAARKRGAEVVVAILHYGMEYRRTPTSGQTQVSEGSSGIEGLLSRGVDVILGSHPHVVEPIVKVVQYADSKANDTYVAYSLGNFLTGQRWRYSDSGVVAYVHIQKQGTKVRVTGISYLPVYVQKTSEDSPRYRILPVLPGLKPKTDTALTAADETRMNQVWAELEDLLYRPDEGIVPLDPADLDLVQGG
jgi:poly-gamma-glutamate capsule biosynthesis protein CapA/YwtB (metallophosphatase superfamily)